MEKCQTCQTSKFEALVIFKKAFQHFLYGLEPQFNTTILFTFFVSKKYCCYMARRYIKIYKTSWAYSINHLCKAQCHLLSGEKKTLVSKLKVAPQIKIAVDMKKFLEPRSRNGFGAEFGTAWRRRRVDRFSP